MQHSSSDGLPRWRIRTWSIRAKIITLLLPPLVSLFGLWIFATSTSAGAALALVATQTNYNEAAQPAGNVLIDLEQERKLSVVYVAGNRTDNKALTAQRLHTDQTIAEYRKHALGGKEQDAASDLMKQKLNDTLNAIGALPTGRQAVDLGQIDRAGIMQLYAMPIEAIYSMYLAVLHTEDPRIGTDSGIAVQLNQAREVLAQEDTILEGVAAQGRFLRSDASDLVQAIGAQRFEYRVVAGQLPEPTLSAYEEIYKGQAAATLRGLEDALAANAKANSAVPIDMTAWRTSYATFVGQMNVLEHSFGDQIVARSTPIGVSIFVRLAVAALAGLIAIVLSVLLSIRIGRSLIRRLSGLRRDAQSLADVRLPAVVARLRRGDEVDIAAETPDLEYGIDEIGGVGNAFSAVQRTAVRSAVQEAQLRRGLNDVFLNIARRSQTLLHRQLAMLDHMERRATDPEELESLFRIDHLATRMRRHAEDLVILAGATPGRGWRNPVPMVDIIRGSVSEVEDYARITFVALPEASVIGRAVADIIHLLAELLENATSYSPPHTQVQITGQLVPNGYAMEIEDRGLGMTAEAIAEANARLAMPPEFDPANSARLGLFVVALLGARHRVRVTLRTSPYGGVTAVVLIPPDLIVGDAEQPAIRALSGVPAQASATDTSGVDAFVSDASDVSGSDAEPSSVGPVTSPVFGSSVWAPIAVSQDSVVEGVGEAERPAVYVPSGAVSAPAVPAASPSFSPSFDDSFGSSPGPASAAPAWGGFRSPSAAPALDEVELTDDGLPRRQRQANLAPQLREKTDELPLVRPSAASQAEPSEVRSPEEVRAMMSSFQAGMVRGRREAAASVNAPHDEGNA
jgi:hypothetical protein